MEKIIPKKYENLHRFAVEYYKTRNLLNTFMKVYNKTELTNSNRANAYKLLKNEYVKSVLAELQEEEKKENQDVLSLDFLKLEYIDLLQNCKDNGDRNNWLKTLNALTKLAIPSLLTDNKSLETTINFNLPSLGDDIKKVRLDDEDEDYEDINYTE